MTMKKKRLDVLLVERKLVESREKAKRLVMAGLVFSDQMRLDKPGMKVGENIPLTVKGKLIPYVSRGGLKLEKALTNFQISVRNKIMIDVGASTGGFTDCALQHGVKLSYAVDVGYNQLDWKLRNDKRVVVMERTNFRYATSDMFCYGTPDLATVDVSFISLRLILPVFKSILSTNSDVIILIKPQFEAGKEQVGQKGVVKDKQTHLQVLKHVLHFAEKEQFQIYNVTFSPITGGDGNVEFLAHLGWQKDKEGADISVDRLEKIVDDAHLQL
ncbi:MAG TPA: TlyA family RNA methyltransferase [Bacillota bacterium]|nr:TlyA family RNA methyltransferase [Bacillota bacterium]